MKKLLISLNLVLLLSVLGFGQKVGHKQDPNEIDQPSRNEQKRDKRVKEKKTNDSEMNDVLLESGTSLDAKLLSTLDVNKSEVGDQVILKTTKSIQQDGEVVVPKGTKLIGRITEVKRKTKDDKTSKISMVFESLQNKNLISPINAGIVSIANVGGNVKATDLFESSASGSSRSSTRSSGGGGLLGGVGNTVGGVANTTTSTVGNVKNTVGDTAGGATNTIGRTLNGIQISQSLGVNAQGSSTLSAENKNLKLQKGTQFQLQLNESIKK